MKLALIFPLFLFFGFAATAQSSDETEIKKVLSDQTMAWNRGSVEDFMKGYWNNDSLMFVGKRGISYGYRQALENYKKNYVDTAHMGKLFFTLLKLKSLSTGYYLVIGKWYLKRTVGDIGGAYSLIFRKINGSWVIVLDHTS
jgi:ketosteroid isomerase-like protein